jgi:hypothetical protein
MNPYTVSKKIKILSLTLTALSLSAYGASAFARDYYVSPHGNNANSGTLGSPLKTIARASDLVVAGDRVIVRAGTYSERVVAKRSGSAGKPITYMAYPNEKAIINGAGVRVPSWGGLVDVNSKNYITIQGLTVINSTQKGIFGYQASNITVDKCYTHNTASSGIGMHYSHNIVISSNEVVLANTTGDQENITAESIVNFEIRNNHVHDGGYSRIGGEGIDAKGNSHNGKIYGNKVHGTKREGIYVDAYSGWLYNVQVYNNRVYSNAVHGIQIGNEAGGYLEDVYVYNNLVYNNEWSGIHVWGGGISGRSHAMGNVYLVNNTVAKNGWTAWGSGISTDNTNISKLAIINNLVSQNTGLQINIPTNISSGHMTMNHNLVDNSNRGWRLQGAADKVGLNGIVTSPLFIDASSYNFKLRANSPAIGKGISAAGIPKFDIDNRSRGNAVDIGAFQH